MTYRPQSHLIAGAMYDKIVAAPAIAAAVTAKTLRVFYGPAISDRASRFELFIGADGKETDIVSAVEWTDDNIGSDIAETVTVPCAVFGRDGVATNIRELAEQAGQLAAAAAQAVKGALVVGLDPQMWCIVPDYNIALMQTPNGAEVVINFTIRTTKYLVGLFSAIGTQE